MDEIDDGGCSLTFILLDKLTWMASNAHTHTYPGHSYVTYGPLLNAASQVVFEGVPSYPDAGRLWQIVDKYGVSHLYTAPTAIRSLMREGAWSLAHDVAHLCSVLHPHDAKKTTH